MVYDRPSWKEIDAAKERGGGKRKRNRREEEIKDHSTRYDKYKADLNRLFDQGMAGELLKKVGKSKDRPAGAADPAGEDKPKEAGNRRKNDGRLTANTAAVANRFKLLRAAAEADDQAQLVAAIDELTKAFGLPDDWEVLVRVLEHPNEELVAQAVAKMQNLLPGTARIPRRATLKERLRSISQTAADLSLRELAADLEEAL